MRNLGKSSEFIKLLKEFHEDLSDENVIRRLQIKKELNIDLNEENAFISSNFHNFQMKYPKE